MHMQSPYFISGCRTKCLSFKQRLYTIHAEVLDWPRLSLSISSICPVRITLQLLMTLEKGLTIQYAAHFMCNSSTVVQNVWRGWPSLYRVTRSPCCPIIITRLRAPFTCFLIIYREGIGNIMLNPQPQCILANLLLYSCHYINEPFFTTLLLGGKVGIY